MVSQVLMLFSLTFYIIKNYNMERIRFNQCFPNLSKAKYWPIQIWVGLGHQIQSMFP